MKLVNGISQGMLIYNAKRNDRGRTMEAVVGIGIRSILGGQSFQCWLGCLTRATPLCRCRMDETV